MLNSQLYLKFSVKAKFIFKIEILDIYHMIAIFIRLFKYRISSIKFENKFKYLLLFLNN
jgi:hypothetical protein